MLLVGVRCFLLLFAIVVCRLLSVVVDVYLLFVVVCCL